MTETIDPNRSFIEIKTLSKDSLRVDYEGARFELTLHNIPILVSVLRGDNKPGKTHFCTPIFGPDRKNLFGLAQHGKMRTQHCNVTRMDQANVVIDHNITDEGYPAGMQLHAALHLEEGKLILELNHHNQGVEAAPVNSGVHCYFDAPEGFRGTKVNGNDISKLITDNRNGAAIDLQQTNTLTIPGKPELILEQRGFKKAVVWVGENSQTGQPDMNYVCIEPVEDDPFGDYFGSPESMIRPSQGRSAELSIAIKSA